MSRLEFESLLHMECHPPMVFHHAVDQWPARHWTEKYLAECLEAKQFQCKISPIDHEDVLMETECLHIQCSLKQYDDWLSRQLEEDNPLSLVDPSKYSCYVDYKYMKDMFIDSPEVVKELSWEMFGFPGRDGTESTLWIGSAGAYTPCHQDTYGFNLVAQIKGSKRWYLFPPNASSHMYPTRVPFEESSVFSEVNVRNPDLRKQPQFQGAQPHIVILRPGDVLYVPRHWWHFVECLEPSISVNTWVEMEEDVHTHLREAVTRFLFTSMADIVPGDNLVNTYEQLELSLVNINYIQQALQAVRECVDLRTKNQKKQSKETDSEQPAARTESELQTTGDKHLHSGICSQLQAEESCSSAATPPPVNLFRKFSEAFKGLMVGVCERGFDKICSDKASQRRRKRHCPSSQSGDGPHDYNISGGSKYAKLEHVTSFKNVDFDNSDLDRDSVNCDTGININNSHTVGSTKTKVLIHDSDSDEQDTSSVKTDTDKQVLKICTVPKLLFCEYLEFLKLEFDYDNENKNLDSSRANTDSKSGNHNLDKDRRQAGKGDRFALDVINSVLDHNVVSAICQNLLEKFKV